jgi:hypothetical protein
MALTQAQLTYFFVQAGGLQPTSAQTLILQILATQSGSGFLTDQQAIDQAIGFALQPHTPPGGLPSPPSPPSSTPTPIDLATPSPPVTTSALGEIFTSANHGVAPTLVQQQAMIDIAAQNAAGAITNDQAMAQAKALLTPVTMTDVTLRLANVDLGASISGADGVTLQAILNKNAAGLLTPDQAMQAVVDIADTTTTVGVETYQFFTGVAPSKAGLVALGQVYAAGGSQAGLNGENRYIAQSVALATQNADATTAFTSAYGALDYAAATRKAYGVIVGSTAAKAAGIDIDAAATYLSRPENVSYLTNFIKANTGLTSVADIDLGVKAAIVGEILYAATTWNSGSGVGPYANAANALMLDLAADGAITYDNARGIDLFSTYGHAAVETQAVKLAGAPLEMAVA